jgi:hypothetical protein
MEETLRQLHLERLARRQPAEVFIPHIPPPPTDAELEARKQVAEVVVEETKEEEEVEEEESCSVCLCPMETKHTLQCGHVICGDCPVMMKTQNFGNGCVGLHPEAGIKVIKCPICRKEDMPTREELIAEIVRIRRGGNFLRLNPPAPDRNRVAQGVARVMAERDRVINAEMERLGMNQPAPRVHRPLNAPAPAPVAVAHNPVALQDGNWLRNQLFRPRRGENQHLNHLPPHFRGDIDRWNILRGHPLEDAIAVGQFLNGGQRVGDGWICGVAGTRRFYHRQYFIPELTENTAPARRNCNNEQCQGNHRSRTARRCPRGCGQFICQACDRCNTNVCQPPIN